MDFENFAAQLRQRHMCKNININSKGGSLKIKDQIYCSVYLNNFFGF